MDDRTWTWHAEQMEEFRKVQGNYEALERALKDVLEVAKKSVAPQAIVTGRVKSFPSFAEKIIRKRHKYKDPVNQLTDLCGVRIITYTQAEVDAICRVIEDGDSGLIVDWENSLDVGSRLGTAEFGYRAIHYIVQVGPLTDRVLGVEIHANARRLKAEIQVCTMLQHVWSAIGHDRIYKSDVDAPKSLKRDLSATAAFLERADGEFSRAIEALDVYLRDFDAYLTPSAMRDEIDKWQAALAQDEADQKAALRIAHLHAALEQWEAAAVVLAPFTSSKMPELRRSLGKACCRSDRKEDGLGHLKAAVELDPGLVEAHCDLGEERIRDEAVEDALGHYRQAIALRPDEPRALVPFVECRIRQEQTYRFLDLARGSFRTAIEECRRRATMGVYLPQAYFDQGRLHLYLGNPYESLAAYAKGCHLCCGCTTLEEEIEALTRIDEAVEKEDLEGLGWVRKLLQLATTVHRFPSGSSEDDRRCIAADALDFGTIEKAPAFSSPVAIVAGGCAPEVAADIETHYGELLRRAFHGFPGTVVSGGTTAGISGIAGSLPGAIPKFGYRPATLPPGDEASEDYEQVPVPGDDYTPLIPIQTWADLLLAGIDPRNVRVLAINGGDLTAFECQIALALGAPVGVLEKSGRAAGELLGDTYWKTAVRFAPLPEDWATLAAFVSAVEPRLPPDPEVTDDPETQQDPLAPRPCVAPGRELVPFLEAAKAIHDGFVRASRGSKKKVHPSMLPWEKLDRVYRRSNLQQAAYALHVLKLHGYEVDEVTEGPFTSMAPSDMTQVEEMAEREHGRFNAERLIDGWRRDEDDPAKKLNASLVPWRFLHDDIRHYDRVAVCKWPEVLARSGYRVQPPASPSS